VWKVAEFLDLAAAQPPVFAPGTGFFYSSTNYNLLGLIIEQITGRSWRREVTRRVIRPLRLTRTDLPAPGQRSIRGAHAHGYGELGGRARADWPATAWASSATPCPAASSWSATWAARPGIARSSAVCGP
jgi:CubicO group peptidase (beta-lactamase class C family)